MVCHHTHIRRERENGCVAQVTTVDRGADAAGIAREREKKEERREGLMSEVFKEGTSPALLKLSCAVAVC